MEGLGVLLPVPEGEAPALMVAVADDVTLVLLVLEGVTERVCNRS